jgi:CRISPR system Cascade subunit CasC
VLVANTHHPAASQVAHAISTNKVEMEFDFFTAVDDLQDTGETDFHAGFLMSDVQA